MTRLARPIAAIAGRPCPPKYASASASNSAADVIAAPRVAVARQIHQVQNAGPPPPRATR